MVLRVGIIGPGIFFHKKHLGVLTHNLDQFSVRAISTSKRKKFQTLKESFPLAKYCADIGQLLKQDIDAVVACIPIPNHYEIGKKTLKAKKHLLIEKPMAHSTASSYELLTLAKKNKVVLIVAESYRYLRILNEIKKILISQRLGKLLFVQLQAFTLLDKQSPYYQTSWRIHPKQYPGILWDGGIHWVSLLRELLGDWKFLGRSLFSINRDLGRYDTVSIHLIFPENVPAVVNISYSIPPVEPFFLTLYFQKGCIKMNMASAQVHSSQGTETFEDSHDVYEDIYQDFWSSITDSRKPKYSAHEAYEDIKALDQWIG